MAVLTSTRTFRAVLDRVKGIEMHGYSATAGTAGNATEWIATGTQSILSIVGCVVNGASIAPAAATGTVVFAGGGNTAAKVTTINGIVYTSDAAPATTGAEPYFWNVEGTVAAAADRLADVVNAGNGHLAEAEVIPAVGTFGFECMPHPDVTASSDGVDTVTFTAKVPGSAGNAITLVTNEDNGTASAATLTGGTDVITCNAVKNAQGTSVTAGTNRGDIGIEAAAASVSIDVVVIVQVRV